jgi:ATP-dependent phosphoenolpyruvate carboxykinase
VIAVNLTDKLVLIGGTSYAGETKKSVFTALNYLLPEKGVMPMHCSANAGPTATSRVLRPVGHRQDDAVGRSSRTLIGDDEHGWSRKRRLQLRRRLLRQDDQPVAEAEPEIYATTERSARCSRTSSRRNPRAGLRRRIADREHALRLPAALHPERFATGMAATRRTSSC